MSGNDADIVEKNGHTPPGPQGKVLDLIALIPMSNGGYSKETGVVVANGWAPDGAVQDQIEDTVKDAVLAARARMPSGESAAECDDCGEPIPEKRRSALPGVRTCVACQAKRDRTPTFSGINRRGSKDSQLR